MPDLQVEKRSTSGRRNRLSTTAKSPREVILIDQDPQAIPFDLRASEVGRAFLTRAADFLANEYVPKIERCLEKLDDQQIWWRPNQESNSIGNLILHLCGNSRQWIISGLGNNPDVRLRDQEFAQREVIARDQLLSHLRKTLAEVDAVLKDVNPQVLLEHRTIQGKSVDILEAVFHVTEHFSMHTGQIILLTKLLTSSGLRFYEFEDGTPLLRVSSPSF